MRNTILSKMKYFAFLISCNGVFAAQDNSVSPEKIRSVILQVLGNSETKQEANKKAGAKVPLKCDYNQDGNKCSDHEVEEHHHHHDDCDVLDEALLHECLHNSATNVVVGTYHSPKNLTVTGDERVGGNLVVGTIDPCVVEPGCRYIVGAVPFDPASEQFEIRFKDKSRLPSDPVGNGAYIELEFITTGTKLLVATGSSGSSGCGHSGSGSHTYSSPVANLGCRFSGFLAYPKMSASGLAVTASGTAFGQNNIPIQCDTSLMDIQLTVTARIESLTKDVAIGFVPLAQANDNAQELGGYLFYGNGSIPSVYTIYPGVLAYKVVSDNVFSVGKTGLVEDVITDDILCTLSDCELLALYKILQSWFGVDVMDHCKAIELIKNNKTRLGGLLRVLNSR